MVDTNEAYKPSQRWILLVGLGSLVWARLKTVYLTTILGLENNNSFPTLKSLPAAARLPVISQSKLLSLAVRVGPRVSVAPLRTAALRGAQGLREVGVNCEGNPCNFFCTASSMERETIYIHGDQATAAAESPRLITSGGSEAGIETPITIGGGGSHSGHVVDSRGPMRELIPLGRSIAANSEDFSRPGEL